MSEQIVILASGFGQIQKGIPKVCERIAGKPIIIRIVETASLLTTDKVIVTINSLFVEEIKRVLNPFLVRFAIQQDRNGSADAVKQALSLEDTEGSLTLVVFGDMPFWRCSTLKRLIDVHRNERAALSLVFLKINEKTPAGIERYGRILKDDEGRIIAIIEPGDLKDKFVSRVKIVNPSLYCFDTTWLKENLDRVPLRDKGDGYPHEKSLPHLVVMAVNQGKKVVEIPLDDHLEALGINTREELEFARQVADSQFDFNRR